MRTLKSALFAFAVVVAACDEGPDDVDRVAEDVEDEDDEELELVESLAPPATPAPTRSDAQSVDEDQPDMALAADVDPEAMRWQCGGDAEGGTYVCCMPWGPYDMPVCCWWNPSTREYECD